MGRWGVDARRSRDASARVVVRARSLCWLSESVAALLGRAHEGDRSADRDPVPAGGVKEFFVGEELLCVACCVEDDLRVDLVAG